MKNSVHAILLLCFVLSACSMMPAAFGGIINESPTAQNDPGFPVGETFLFRLKWGLVPVGTARIVTEWTEDTPPAVRMRIHVRSNAFLDRIYRIDDYIESIATPEKLLSTRFEKNMNEGSTVQRDVTTFDRNTGLVTWSNLLTSETREYEAPLDVRDILATMFALRPTPFKLGEVADYVVAGNAGPSPVKVAVIDERPYKTDRYGAIQAFRMRPDVSNDALFLGRIPRDLWISAAKPHVLLFLSVDAPVGNIKLILDAIEGVETWPGAQQDARDQ